ncbi:MAG: RNB domain-containing ribonuclease, partial [Gammaproteobacteria bacterium]|nr:RNB domain-containing ribonuclease [Gammaproteobacteria bacterium]
MAKRPGKQARESKYEHPIPSREEILKVMEAMGRPLVLVSLAEQFGIRTEAHRRALENRLRAMVRDAQLLRNRAKAYCLTRHLDLITGRVQAHRDGYGFLIPDDESEDIYLSAREMAPIWDGDRIAVHVSESRRGGREGHVVEILQRARTEIVGRFTRERGIDLVFSEGDGSERVLIPRGETGGARGGDIVRVEVVQYPTARTDAIGRVVRVVGRMDDPGIETDVAILAHGLPHEWPESVDAQIADLAPQVPASAKRDREDLRKLPLVTIDGADARDFDDAVYAERKGENWRLIVAIADVSHYVEPGTELDTEARARGTSVYFPDRVLPMLPEALSNGLCSLNPHVDRLCLCCEMTVDGRGNITRSRFFEGVMRSAARLTYVEVARLLDGGKSS